MSGKKFIDITIPLKTGMVHWPGDPEVKIERVSDVKDGDDATISHISMGNHTGTHMDAPLHFIKSGGSMDDLPFDAVIGKARVIEIKNENVIDKDELKKHNLSEGEIILFKTKNSSLGWGDKDFIKDYVYISNEAAEFIASTKVKTIGIDYLSIGGFEKNTKEVHDFILGAGIWVIEGLDLSKVSEGEYELICLPIKIKNGDGAPVRAVLRN
jgi:arylformamidase